MKNILNEENKKTFLMERGNYNVQFTLLNMGNYVGHKNRQWYESAKPHWETMLVDIISQDPSKCLTGEFLIDSNGDFQRLLISDNNGNKRIILSVKPHYGVKEEDYEYYYGKGIHKEQNSWIQEMYVEKVPGELLDKSYYYDQTTGKFIDDNGNEAPGTVLTKKQLGNLFRNSARCVSENFAARETEEEINDIEFEL